MRIMFLVFVVSIAALILTLLALTRHIRKHNAEPGNPLQLPGTQPEDSLTND